MFPRLLHIGLFKVVHGKLQLFRQSNVSVACDPIRLRITRPDNVVNTVDILQECGNALQTVCQLRRNRIQIHASTLLKVGKLRDLQPVQHYLPANSPGPERGRFPIVLFEFDIVLAQINSHRAQRIKIKLLHVFRRRLQDDLELQMFVQPVRILAIAPISGTPRRLDVSHSVRLRPQHPQKCFRRHGPRADLDVIGLLQHASPFRPKGLEPQDEFLKRRRIGFCSSQRVLKGTQHSAFSPEAAVQPPTTGLIG